MHPSTPTTTLNTPAALIDVARMNANIQRMQSHLDALGVRFRPHVKTTKCHEVTQAQIQAGAQGVTVSTLKEAEQFFASGISDILYAVGMVPAKLPQALALRRAGCQLKIIVDSAAAAQAVVDFGRQHGERFEVLLEVDVDGHRAGIQPQDDLLITVGRILVDGGMQLVGVLSHAGSSYECNTPDALVALAEQERHLSVLAAERLRAAGLPCQEVSIGSTPTALSAVQLEGVTEVRAGVYVFFDLVMHNVGVCALSDIALSVLTTVIGHQEDKGWAMVDAGWMAMSRDRGTQRQQKDFGYGQVCTLDGDVLEGWHISGANQEHGIVSFTGAHTGAERVDITTRFPIGTQLRILPNHACATGAQHPHYVALEADGSTQQWPRFYGW